LSPSDVRYRGNRTWGGALWKCADSQTRAVHASRPLLMIREAVGSKGRLARPRPEHERGTASGRGRQGARSKNASVKRTANGRRSPPLRLSSPDSSEASAPVEERATLVPHSPAPRHPPASSPARPACHLDSRPRLPAAPASAAQRARVRACARARRCRPCGPSRAFCRSSMYTLATGKGAATATRRSWTTTTRSSCAPRRCTLCSGGGCRRSGGCRCAGASGISGRSKRGG
jgi:hypothetical protein